MSELVRRVPTERMALLLAELYEEPHPDDTMALLHDAASVRNPVPDPAPLPHVFRCECGSSIGTGPDNAELYRFVRHAGSRVVEREHVAWMTKCLACGRELAILPGGVKTLRVPDSPAAAPPLPQRPAEDLYTAKALQDLEDALGLDERDDEFESRQPGGRRQM